MRSVKVAILLVAALGAEELSAQSDVAMWPRLEAGISGGLFVDYPSEEAEPYCEQRSRGVVGHASWWFARWIGIQGSLVLTGGAADENDCLIAQPPSMAPIQIDEPFQRNRYEAGSFSGTMVATDVGVVVEPMRGADVSPRAVAGVGRMANQGESLWYLGGGVRFGFGRHALTIDTEWWNFTVDHINETLVYRQGGALEVLDSTRFAAGLSMFLLRLGWAVDVR